MTKTEERKKVDHVREFCDKISKHLSGNDALQHYLNNYLGVISISDEYGIRKCKKITKKLYDLLNDKHNIFKNYLMDVYSGKIKLDFKFSHSAIIENYIKI